MIKATDRRIGFYPISIATSLALEGAMHTGEYDDPSAKDFPLRGKVLFVNMRTLYRNVYNAFGSTDHPYLKTDTIIEALSEDMTGIVDAVKRGEPECEVKFYYCTYKSLNKILGELNYYNRGSDDPKDNSTAKQKHYRELEVSMFEALEEAKEDLPSSIILEEFDFYLESKKPTVLLTHLPTDLLSEDKMPSCLLLESHTGKVKGRNEWASKLYGKPKNIPFSKMTLSVFGDGQIIAPQPPKFRKKLLELGAKFRWDHRTSDVRLIEAVKSAKEPHLVTFLRKYK